MILTLSNITKSIPISAGINKKVIDNFSIKFDFQNSNFISIVAPFGSGKSTLLKIISGLLTVDSGKIIVNGENYTESGKTFIYLPTNSISIPWLSVEENIRFETKKDALPEDKVKLIISLIGLEGYEKHIPHKNSYGFRFRISLGRALVTNPDLILLDEPFNIIDSVTKEEIFQVLKNVSRETGIKFLLATSNILDAMLISDEIIILPKLKDEVKDSIKLVGKFSSYNEIITSEDLISVIKIIQSHTNENSGFQLKEFSV
ncbi:MAG: ATP-binding cassette domain-containing protein [Ignavibacterium sp.]